jgi:hypothetical protein
VKNLINRIKLLRMRSKSAAGLDYVQAPSWEIDAPSDWALFFRNIAKIMPEESVLFVEGTNICAEVEEFYKQQSLPCDLKLAAGTIWPKPRFYHIPVQQPIMEKIAELAQGHAWPEICDHLRIHDGNRLLLHWFDFPTDPLYIAGTVAERDIIALSDILNSTYKRI